MGMPSACHPCGDTSLSQSLSLLRFSLWPATEELFRICFVQALNSVTFSGNWFITHIAYTRFNLWLTWGYLWFLAPVKGMSVKT